MRKMLLFALAAVCFVAPAMADQIDQNQPDGSVYMAAFAQTDLAQSFKQTNSDISGAGILLQAGVGGTDNVRISVWDNLPNAGGNMLAQAQAQGTAGQWVDVFWSAIPITPATTYYLVFDGNVTLGIAGSVNNPYPDGMVFANPGYNPFPSFDYAFRTYYSGTVATESTTWGGIKALFR